MNTEKTVNTIKELEAAIYDKKAELVELNKSLAIFEPDVSDSDYDDWLDEMEGEVEVCGMSYCASTVLKAVDPIAYRCGFNDYVDSLDFSEFSEYGELEESIEELEQEIEDLEEELNAIVGE